MPMNERFQRHTLIEGWKQGNLSQAVVIIIGMGALGNEAARVLALAGVGKLILCDPDVIETSNLSRMTLFRPSDVGQLKVDVAAETLQAISPQLTIETRPELLVHGVGLAELRDASLVMSCLDSRSARLQLTGRCRLVSAPYIDGGTNPWGGEVRPYINPDGACYGCSLTVHERAIVDDPWSCLDVIETETVGAAIPSSALVGVWMGSLAVRYLMHLKLPGGSLVLKIPSGTTQILKQERDPTCELHDPLPDAKPLAITHQDTVADLLAVLPPDSVPSTWVPVQYAIDCLKCGETARWRKIPMVEPCPNCKNDATPLSTREIVDAPPDMTLHALGIAPREIMSVYVDDQIQMYELSG